VKVAVIGGGAAGFFSAIAVKENYPKAQVVLIEKGKQLLSKVKVSGGGRCNVTNGATSIKTLASAYPRGSKLLKKAFGVFSTVDTRAWFESRGVALKEEADGRVFPVSNDSQTIIDCLMHEIDRLGIQIDLNQEVKLITKSADQFILSGKEKQLHTVDQLIIASGGSPKRKGLEWLEHLGHQIVEPLPSLFTFNMPNEAIRNLMGLSVKQVLTSVQGSKLKAAGPLLITHWGMSGPAILKLSAFGARALGALGYSFTLQVNWANELNHEVVAAELRNIRESHPNKQLENFRPFQLPERLWVFLLNKCELPPKQSWTALNKKALNRLCNILTNDVYKVEGKTTFKEEFVTCGGVSLESVDFSSMQSKTCPGLYFCGEVLDIDGITGGYNFQAAWTTAFIAGKLS
jgi:predicted Rossmann fold flavoprotein